MESYRKSRYGIDIGRLEQPYLSHDEVGVKDAEDFSMSSTRLSVSSQFQEPNNERRWRLSHLKTQFVTLELHKLFDRYSQRISHGYFSQFLTLQIVLVALHFITLLSVSIPENVFPDLILYGLILFFSIVILVITDAFVKKRPNLLKVLAGSAFVMVFFMNFFIPYYYRSEKYDGNLRPAFTTYLIISNYIFLNVHNDLVAVVLGLFVSVFHLVTLILVTYQNSTKIYQRLGSDALYLICINGLGMHFRYMNEIVIRRSFLDRRSCVESTHQLKFEEEQANNLMSSIIPQHIIAGFKKDIMNYYLEGNSKQGLGPLANPYLEHHSNVSILFADIVNYTAMTTKVKETELLDILNELFGRFDDASDELKVLRIKFLGDCYYCVAGIPPNPAPNHAEACVDLGLRMISIIAEIRKRHQVDIYMRIGVHSGKINSGIIGEIKWQYDIWSTDVDIANKMETEGVEGMVHITEATKSLLRKTYHMFKSNKIVNNEPTYLISPNILESQVSVTSNLSNVTEASGPSADSSGGGPRRSIFVKRTSNLHKDIAMLHTLNSQRSISLNTKSSTENAEIMDPKRHTFPHSNERRFSGNNTLSFIHRRSSAVNDRRLTPSDRKRRTAFMNNNIKRYKERLEETNNELEETIEKMRLSKYEQWFKNSEMYKFWIVFKDLRSEIDFIKIPDPLFKYYLLSEVILCILVYLLQNLTMSKWNTPNWTFFLTIGLLGLVFLPMSWTHFLWCKFVVKSDNKPPKNKILYFLYNSSMFITNNVATRVVIYTGVYILFCLIVLTEWVECNEVDGEYREPTTIQINFISYIFRTSDMQVFDTEALCVVPWHMTETCGLAIMMSFLFLRMYMWLKTFYATTIALVYSACVFTYGGVFYGDSQTFNYLLDPKVSHVLSVLFLTLILHMVDRQTEYMNRLDHLWYKNLEEKENEASKIQAVNKGLLENILPVHVAELYLNVNRSEEVYYETYDDAAAMFATITNFNVEDMGSTFLSVMNHVIREFDLLLKQNTFGRPIEKIKIAKWTYMAACGLAPGLGNVENIRRDQGNHVVISLLKFAASLMQKLQEVDPSFQEMKLRIGISHGFIAAGVVGSKKPLYDIWGDAVNMASRMDTTGLVDHIQVLEPTAKIIEEFGYVCHYRGKTTVKGRDQPVPTYFVALTKDFKLVRRNNK